MRGLIGALLLVAGVAEARSPLVEARPYYARAPKGLDPAKAAPLLLVLHPYYPGDGRQVVERWGLGPMLDDKGLLAAAPDGTLEGGGREARRFWNATDACCAFGGPKVDDVAYLTAVVADMRERFQVDDKRVFVLGYSNGGFMVHRLLCERADLFAAGASLAGAAWNDPARCKPGAPAALLQIHGDADQVVRLEGGIFRAGAYPSAAEGVARWARHIGCAGPPTAGPARDLVPALPGAETAVLRHACPAGAAELWTVRGGGHGDLSPAVRAAVDFLLAHPRR